MPHEPAVHTPNVTNILNIEEQDRVKLTVRNLVVSARTSSSLDNKKYGNGLSSWLFSRSKGGDDADDDDDDEDNDVEKHPGKTIINGVDLDLNPGEVLAILGGSGSGKTTLLNTLSQRVTSSKSFRFEGMLKYNEHTNIDNIRSSYLLQDDSFLPFLTVHETLKFGADLKLPSSTTKTEKKYLIDSILKQLGIDRIESTIISSSPGLINLSGGERRLVSLAQQLLNKPSLLFLDEPTTGLDATSSIRLVTVLQSLAKEFGIAIVLTIHQPRYEILEKIDRIAILAKGGKLVYNGGVNDSMAYFDKLGYRIQGNVNLADFLIDLSMKDYSSPELEFESTKRVHKLVTNWSTHQTNVLSPVTYENTFERFKRSTKGGLSRKKKNSLFQEIHTLTRRTLVITMRDRFSLMMLNFGMVVISLIDGWLFYKPTHDIAGIRTLQSQLYVTLETIGFVPLYYELSRLWQLEGRFYFREKNEGIVSAPGWIISRHIAKFIAEIFPVSLLFSLIVYFMWGLRLGSLSYFFIFFSVTLLTNLTGICCSMLCFAVAQDFSTSSLYTNVYYQLQNNGCGFFVNAKTMPVYVRWTKYITFFWYGFGALASNQFTDWMGDCPSLGQNNSEDACLEYSGIYVLRTLGFSEHWTKLPVCILLCWAIGFDILAIFFLHIKSTNVSMSKSKTSNFLTSDSDMKREVDNSVEALKNDEHKKLLVDITLENIEVWVSPKRFDLGLITILYQWCYKKLIQKDKTITKDYTGKKLLNNINAKFSSGKVNAVLGPSGSGKSTLLNYLAGRLPNTSTFADAGNIYVNNTKIPQGKSLGKLCSYVTQYDDHLIPTLTVRETLYFQGKIRLPKLVKDNPAQLNDIINDLIMKMGLKDCENIPIGNDFMKGISGGEKKRVSIAVQLLDDSKILLLDEPTSGLDSFSSSQILNILNKLATNDNKTIILTIHQPKLELFQQFGKILLLSRGGNTIYNDLTLNLNPYLTGLGYPCPKLKNIADHLLDLVSQNIDEEPATAEDRIQLLRMNFNHNYKELNYVDEGNFDSLSKLIVTKYKKSFTDSYSTLTRRQLLTMVRDRNVMICRLFQIVATAGVQLLYFAPLKNSYDGISNRLGVIQETMNMLYIGFLNNIVVYPAEVSYFATEYADGVIDIELFFLAYLTIELPFEIVGSLLFSLLVGIATDLSRSASMFFSMFYVSLLTINCGESLGIIVVTMFRNLETAINILANLLTIGIFMAGTMSLHLPPFFKLWNYISPLKYGVGAIAKLGFADQYFKCEIGDTCELNTGDAVLKYYNLDSNFPVFMGVLAAIVVIYRFVAYLLLCIKIRMG